MTLDIVTVEGQTLKGGNEYSPEYLGQLEDFFVNAPVGALIADKSGRILRANATVVELLGFRREQDAIGRAVYEFFEPGLRSELESSLNDASGKPSASTLANNVSSKIRNASGNTEPVWVDCNYKLTPSGQVEHSRWFVRPQAARVLPSLELDIEQPLDSLSESERRARFDVLNDFFEGAPIGVHFVGLNGLILRSNQREKELLGYGRVPREYDGIHVSKIHWDKKKIELLLSRLAESVPVIDEKAFMLRKGGEIFVARIYSGLRLKGGAFENTRCFLFADPEQNQEPVEMQEYTFPSFNDFGQS